MSQKPLCIYHGNCADGFTAAWAVWKRFGDQFDYHAGVYQQPPPDVTDRDVVLVDFSYKRDVLSDMARKATSVLVLDHHKTAIEDLNGLTIPASWEKHIGWSRVYPGKIQAVFDLDRSGAGIAWDFFHPDTVRPALVHYVEDRDLWKFGLAGSRNINAVVFSYPYEFEAWEELSRFIHFAQPEAERAGAAIERKHHKDVAELVAAYRREMVIGGHWVPVANLPYTLTSDAGHLMCKPYVSGQLTEALRSQGEVVTPPFAACYWDTAEGRVFSLRSVGDFDVSDVAKKYGGGGHKNAAGFRLPHGVEP